MTKKQNKALDAFFEKLANRPHTDTSFNPYRDERLLANLRIYLEYQLEQVTKGIGHAPMLVGEAPGYQGCRITGLPFTSSHQIMESRHPVMKKLRGDFFFEKVTKEPTATIMWEFMRKDRVPPIFWNSFPFHPHKDNEPLTNRAPNKFELEEGQGYIAMLIEIFKPTTVYAVGRKAEQSLDSHFSEVVKCRYIRHPSNGGKTQFLAGVYAEEIESWDLSGYFKDKKAA